MKNSSPLFRFLVVSNLLLITIVGFFLLTSFGKQKKPVNFEEINAERINILGTNGKPVLVLSNRKYMPGPGMNGKTYSRDVIDGREYMSGMIFFNELGDEVGGLIYAGIKKDSTHYSAVGHLSFDQWQQNQVLALDYNDNGKTRYSGLRLWDRPTDVSFDKTLDMMVAMSKAKGDKIKMDSLQKIWNESKARGENGVERMFIGSRNNEAQIQLRDKLGNVRVKLYVAENGEARLEFLNEKGEVTSVFPK